MTANTTTSRCRHDLEDGTCVTCRPERDQLGEWTGPLPSGAYGAVGAEHPAPAPSRPDHYRSRITWDGDTPIVHGPKPVDDPVLEVEAGWSLNDRWYAEPEPMVRQAAARLYGPAYWRLTKLPFDVLGYLEQSAAVRAQWRPDPALAPGWSVLDADKVWPGEGSRPGQLRRADLRIGYRSQRRQESLAA